MEKRSAYLSESIKVNCSRLTRDLVISIDRHRNIKMASENLAFLEVHKENGQQCDYVSAGITEPNKKRRKIILKPRITCVAKAFYAYLKGFRLEPGIVVTSLSKNGRLVGVTNTNLLEPLEYPLRAILTRLRSGKMVGALS